MTDTENTFGTARQQLAGPAQRIQETQLGRLAAGEIGFEDLQEFQTRPTTSADNARLLFRQRQATEALPPAIRDVARFLTDLQIGATRGTRSLAVGTSGALATGLDLISADEISQDLLVLTAEANTRLEQELPRQTFSVEELLERGTVSDFVDFTANALGEQVPIIASVILSGGAGAGIGAFTGQMLTRGLINPAQAAALVTRFTARGTLVGGFAGITGIETGFTALEQVAVTGQIEPFVALGAGTIKGALESAVPLAFASRFGLTRALSGKFMETIDRVVRGTGALGFAAGTGVTEFTTEGLQEIVDIAARRFVDENFDVLGPEAASRLLEAATTGALVGTIFGGIGGIAGRGNRAETVQPLDPIDAQRIVAQPGDQLELFPGRSLGRDQQGAEQILGQGELFSGLDLGQAPEDISPDQLDLFDTLPETGPSVVQDELFPEGPISQEALASGIFVRGEVGLFELQSGEKLFDTIARKGAREIELFRIDPSRAREIPVEAVSTVGAGGVALSAVPKGLLEKVDPTTITAPSGIDPAVAIISDRGFRGATATPGELAGELTEGITFQPRSQVSVRRAEREFDIRRDRLFTIDPTKIKPDNKTALVRDAHRLLFNATVMKFSPEDKRQAIENLITFVKRTSDSNKEEALLLIDDFASDLALPSAEAATFSKYNKAVELGLRVAPTVRGFNVVDAENLSPSDFIEVSSLPTGPGNRSIGEIVFDNTVFFDNDLTGVKVIGSSGTSFDWEFRLHTPGTALIVTQGETLKNKIALRRLQQQANIIMKRLGFKDEKLVIFLDALPVDSFYAVSNNADGSYWSIGGNRHIIGISSKTLSDPERLAETFAHEVAHMVVMVEFRNLGPAGQEIIHNAYRRSLQGTVGQNFTEGSLRLRGLQTTRATQVGTAAASDFVSEMERRNLDVWFNFDEWMAEQITRWQQTSERAISFSDNWFKKIWQKLNNLFKSFQIGKTRLQPEIEMERWMESLLDRTEQAVADPTIQALSMIGVAEATRDSREVNAKRLDEPVSLDVAPDQSASVLAKNVLGKLDLPSPHAGLRPQINAELDKYNRVIKYGWNVLQLAIKNRHIRGLQTYVENLNLWYNKKMEIITRGDGRVKEMQQLGKRQMDALSKLILEMAQLVQQPTPTEIIDAANRLGVDREGLLVYAKIVEDFAFMLNEMERVLVADARRSFTDPNILAAELANLRGEFQRFREKPYFPFMRFGDFTVVAREPGKGGRVLHMESFPFEQQQKVALKRIRKQFPQALVRADKIPEEVQIFRGMPPAMLRNMGAKLSLSKQQLEWLDALVFAAAPSQSFRKQFTRRRSVPGFSEDVMRSYANYFFHGANHLSRAEFRADLEESITDVEEEAATLARTTQQSLVKRRGIVDFMKRHLRYVMEPANDWAFLRSFAFLYHIGFAPDSALVNLTQTPMVTYPYLAARFSDAGALNALRKASFDLHKMYGSGKQNLDPLFLRALDLGIREGVLEETQATALAGTAEGSNLTRGLPGTTLTRAGREIAYWGSWMFQHAEMINRRVTFRAGYALAKGDAQNKYVQSLRQSNPLQFSDLIDQGWVEEEALAYLAGKDAVRRTQFEYAAWARPRFMQGKKGTFFVFFNFLQNTLWFARHSPGRGRYLLILLGLAGLMGLPGMEDIGDIAEFIGKRMFGKRFNLEEEVREFVVTHGFENPDLILHGISRDSFGMTAVADAMGLPMPSVDLSGRLGLGRIVPGVEGLTRGDFAEGVTASATDIAGAAFNIPINVARSLGDNHPDLFKRWERSLPRALRNLSKARRFLIEGEEVTRSNAQLVEFDINDPTQLAEVVAQGLGFQPTRVSQRWDAIMAQRETLAYWATRRGMLLQQFDWARTNEDREAMADVRAAIRVLNNEVPEGGLKITVDDLTQSARARARSRALEEQGLPGQRRQIPTAQRLQELFPEVFGEEEVK